MAGSVRLGPLGVLHVAHVLEGCNGIGKCLSLVIRADAGAGLSRLGHWEHLASIAQATVCLRSASLWRCESWRQVMCSALARGSMTSEGWATTDTGDGWKVWTATSSPHWAWDRQHFCSSPRPTASLLSEPNRKSQACKAQQAGTVLNQPALETHDSTVAEHWAGENLDRFAISSG